MSYVEYPVRFCQCLRQGWAPGGGRLLWEDSFVDWTLSWWEQLNTTIPSDALPRESWTWDPPKLPQEEEIDFWAVFHHREKQWQRRWGFEETGIF